MIISAKKILPFLFIFGFLYPKTSFASELDSLYQALAIASPDTSKVNTILDLCWLLHRNDVKEVENLANQSLELSNQLNFKRGIGDSYNYLSWVQISEGKFDKALELSLKAVAIAEETGNKKLYTSSYNDIARIYVETGRDDEALIIWQDLIKIDKENNQIEGVSINYLNMALLLKDNGNNEEARKYFLQALEAAQNSNQDMIKSAVHLEIAEMYYDENNIHDAEQNYTQALEIAIQGEDKWVEAFSTLGLSTINIEKGNKELALAQAKKATQLTDIIGDNTAVIAAKSKLAEILRQTGEYEASIQISFFIIQLAEKHNLLSQRLQGYLDLSKTYREIKNFEKAFFFSEKYHSLQDSTFSQEKARNILDLEKKYHSDLKEKENTVLKLQQEEQRLQIKQKNTLNKSLLFILLLLGIVGLLAYRRYKDRNSAHKLLELKVKERTEELRLMNNNLEKSNKELERFAYIASHDLREPLRNISGFAGLLKKELKPQTGSNTDEYLSFITDNTSQLSTLIQDILTYSKLKQENEDQTMVIVDPNDIIKKIKSSLAHTIKENKVKIFVKGNLPLLKSSGKQIYFLFKNLIENGIKYNNNIFPRVDIICNDLGDQYEFLVKDNGIGIDPEYSDKVFEMFTRLHNRKKFKGTGLGLSLCKRIVENHGGTIRVNSEKNKGSSFVFTLPKYQLEEINDSSKNQLVTTA